MRPFIIKGAYCISVERMPKAQFAMIEALASLLFLLAVIGIGVNALEYGYLESESAKSFDIMNIASYDFINEIYSNRSIGTCINETNTTCIDQYLEEYYTTYKLRSIELDAGRSYMIGNATSNAIERCFPYGGKELCLYIAR
jgi:Tfp pilus assembly protein PilV